MILKIPSQILSFYNMKQEGEILASVPYCLLINHLNAGVHLSETAHAFITKDWRERKIKKGKAIDCDEEANLMVYIHLMQSRRNPSAFWYPWTSTLPPNIVF